MEDSQGARYIHRYEARVIHATEKRPGRIGNGGGASINQFEARPALLNEDHPVPSDVCQSDFCDRHHVDMLRGPLIRRSPRYR